MTRTADLIQEHLTQDLQKDHEILVLKAQDMQLLQGKKYVKLYNEQWSYGPRFSQKAMLLFIAEYLFNGRISLDKDPGIFL